MEQVKVYKEDVERFKSSKIWGLVEETLRERIEIIRNELELGMIFEDTVVEEKSDTFGASKRVSTTRKEMGLMDYKERQAEIKTLRYLLNLPELLINDQTETKED